MKTKKTNYPTGDNIIEASIRGESILAYYISQAGKGRDAADLIADVLACVRVEQSVSLGEAQAEGDRYPSIDSPSSVIEEAESILEVWEADFHREQAAERERLAE